MQYAKYIKWIDIGKGIAQFHINNALWTTSKKHNNIKQTNIYQNPCQSRKSNIIEGY